MAADDLEHGYTDFLECIAAVMFAQVKLVVADRMQGVELRVYLFYYIFR